MSEIRVSNSELATVREVTRDMAEILEKLHNGSVSKIVLTQRNQMRAVLLTVETYQALVDASAAVPAGESR